MSNKVVLDIQEMQELESLGIDTSVASFMWTSINDDNYNPVTWLPIYRAEPVMSIEKMRKSFPHTYKEGNIYYAFNTDDMLSLIDKLSLGTIRIELFNNNRYWIAYIILNDTQLYETVAYVNVIDAVFDAFKYCKIHNYIDND